MLYQICNVYPVVFIVMTLYSLGGEYEHFLPNSVTILDTKYDSSPL
jgi:hypothetical protein